ncbi:MAG: type II secretion system F family protein [Eubacterium sp.]
MPKYKYKSKNMSSQWVHGVAEAVDENALRKMLRQKNEFLIDCHELNVGQKAYKMKNMELSDFAREIESMLASGITVIRALGIMMERDIKPNVKKVYQMLYREVQQGITLSDAMENLTGSFPNLIVNMFKAGESSGQMTETAHKMAIYYEKEHRLHTKIRNAMIYPVLLLVATVVVVIGLFTWILPQFFSLFADMGSELPGITKMVMGMSTFITTNWIYLLIGALLIFMILQALLKVPSVRLEFDKLKVHLPWAGKLIKVIYTARFARTLSSLYSSGLSMINAMEISARIVGNTYIEHQFKKSTQMVRSGGTLSDAIGSVDGFDKKLVSTIFIGEETGNLDNMLDAIADSYDYDSEMVIQKMVTIIEPVMIIIMAVIIGTVMLSVMVPIMSMYQNIG